MIPILHEQNGIYYSQYGLELVAQKPDFIQQVWKNPARVISLDRPVIITHLTGLDGARYTEKFEKSEGLNNLKRYLSFQMFLEKKQYIHSRAAKAYFADGDNVLLEHVPNILRSGQNYCESLNPDAFDEFMRLSRRFNGLETGFDLSGNAIIIDPHCPIDLDDI